MASRLPCFSAKWLGRPPDWSRHTRRRFRLTREFVRGQHFDIIHAFRFSCAPYALDLRRTAAPSARLHLDVDDLESLTRSRLSELHRAAGEARDAGRETLNAIAYARLEPRYFGRFDRVYVCSQVDASRVAGACPSVRLLPNTVEVPATAPAPPGRGDVFRLLFIGSLGYVANRDALRWWCAEIFPRLRATIACELVVAGHGASPATEAWLQAQPGVRYMGSVRHAADAYRDVHAVIAPLRGGGGTRIKILEAFAHGRPVVCTGVALEGIEAEPDRHCLLADAAESFAEACVRLAENEALRASLTANARDFVSCRHCHAVLRECLA